MAFPPQDKHYEFVGPLQVKQVTSQLIQLLLVASRYYDETQMHWLYDKVLFYEAIQLVHEVDKPEHV